MRRRPSGVLLPLIVLTVLSLTACTPTATPMPRPTNTPQPFATVIVTRAARAAEPSSTPTRTLTPAPTATRLPTSTPLPSATPISTLTPAGGAIGVVTTEGLVTIRVEAEQFLAGLNAQRESFYFATDILGFSDVRLEDRVIRFNAVFNDFTARGLTGNFSVILRPADGEILADITRFETRGAGQIPTRQIGLLRELIRLAVMENVLPEVFGSSVPNVTDFRVISVSLMAGQIWVTARVAIATPTPPAE